MVDIVYVGALKTLQTNKFKLELTGVNKYQGLLQNKQLPQNARSMKLRSNIFTLLATQLKTELGLKRAPLNFFTA